MDYSNPKNDNKTIPFQVSTGVLKEIGEIFQKERERKSLSIKDIKDKTHIPYHILVAIEEASRDVLPEDFYVISYITKYAKALGLNSKPLVEKYTKSKNNSNKSNPVTEKEAFDSLFDKSNSSKVVTLFKDKALEKPESSEKKLFKIYHFYLIVLSFLGLTALYLVFQTISNKHSETAESSYFTNDDGYYKKHTKKKKHIKSVQNQTESKVSQAKSTDVLVMSVSDSIENEINESQIKKQEIKPPEQPLKQSSKPAVKANSSLQKSIKSNEPKKIKQVKLSIPKNLPKTKKQITVHEEVMLRPLMIYR